MSGMPGHAHSDESAYNKTLQVISDAVARSDTRISLSCRRLTSLPPEIGQLECLKNAYVADNPLKDPPPAHTSDVWSREIGFFAPDAAVVYLETSNIKQASRR